MPRFHRIALAGLAAVLLAPPGAADHTPIGAQEPTAEEQWGIYTLNRARSDPERYGQEIGVDLSALDPVQPLAVNRNLTGSARYHAREKLEHGYAGHVNPDTNEGPNQMAADHGFDLFGNGLGFDWGNANSIESLALGVNRIPTFPSALALLIEDEGVPSLGHRIHLLGASAPYESHREIGCGVAVSGKSRQYAIQTGYRGPQPRFLTGVVFADANGNLRYDPGEGLGGATVETQDGTTTTLAEGGWALESANGAYLVTCSGGAYPGVSRALCEVDGDNVEVDFHAGEPAGEVDFRWQDGAIPPGPDVTVTASANSGISPLTVDFTASGVSGNSFYSWILPNDSGTGPVQQATLETPGTYSVIVDGLGLTGSGLALAVVAVGGSEGGGNATTPPADDGLTPTKVSLKMDFANPEKSQATFTGTIELPAGFVPLGKIVTPCVAGVAVSFTLDSKGKATAGNGKLVIKAPWPKDGSGVPAGTMATVQVKFKEAWTTALVAAGLRDRTESRTLPAVPFALVLHQQAYYGTAAISVASVQKKKATGKL